MRSAAVTIAVVVAFMLLVSFASPLGVKRTHLVCEGMVTNKYADGTTARYPNARLGVTIEELSPLLFWADKRQTFSYSFAYIASDGRVERVMDNSIPFDSFNDVFLSAGIEENSNDKGVAFYYDNISTVVQFIQTYQGDKAIFDGFCGVRKQVV